MNLNWFKRKERKLTMRDGGFGSPLEADCGRMLAAIDVIGRREIAEAPGLRAHDWSLEMYALILVSYLSMGVVWCGVAHKELQGEPVLALLLVLFWPAFFLFALGAELGGS